MARKSTAESAATTETFAGLTIDQIKDAINAMTRADMKKLEEAMKKRKEAIIAANKVAAEKKKAETEKKRQASEKALKAKNGDEIDEALKLWGTSGNDRALTKTLNGLPKPALSYIAKAKGLKGYSAMKKAELVDFLMDAHGEAELASENAEMDLAA